MLQKFECETIVDLNILITKSKHIMDVFSLQGFSTHLASTILEWCLAACFLAYFYTFIRDFQQISLNTESRLHAATLHHDVLFNDYSINPGVETENAVRS